MANLKNTRIYVITDLLEQVKRKFMIKNNLKGIQIERAYTNDSIIDQILREYVNS
ncbi:MAG: hypothetical protein PVH61_31780 [Candidatus Aminicenantes bacterium]|jgi:hypothetical protein